MAVARWIIVAVVAVVLAALGGWISYEHYTARREAVTTFKKAVSEERQMMEEDSKIRDPVAHDAALSRLKDHLVSGEHTDRADAAAAQAMAELLGKFQMERREFDAVLVQIRQEKVLSFAIHERTMIEQHRKILHALLESNDQLTYFDKHADELLRAELVKTNVPLEIREQTVMAFSRPRATTHAAQIRIYQAYQAMGEAGLEMLDLLDTNWGKWQFDETAGQLRSEDHDTVVAYRDLAQKLGAAEEELQKAKQELAEKVKIVKEQLDAQMKAALSR